MNIANILVVDDEPDIRHLLKEILEDEGHAVALAENAAQARDARREKRPDLILLDIWMPDADGITLLKEWADEGTLDAPVIMMSGHGTVETAVEATRLGAYDYLEKPLSHAKLLLTIKRALEASSLQEENLGLRRQLVRAREPVGKSAILQDLREQALRIAQHDTPVFITGEPGVGKELMARYIHCNSNRADAPFVDVGIAGMTPEDIAVELFSKEENGQVHFGALERANAGTLFLQDVADMSMDTQARLVSALQSHSLMRIGGTDVVNINVRIICSSTSNVAQLVNEGRFREDLFYFLNVVPLHIPALREHREDVPELLEYYSALYSDQQNLTYRRFTVGAQNQLRNYDWPGNVRELCNLVQRLLILGSEDDIEAEDIQRALGSTEKKAPGAEYSDTDMPLRQAREQFEKAYFIRLLKLHNGNVSKVAAQAGIERTHLYRKLRALGVDPKQAAGRK